MTKINIGKTLLINSRSTYSWTFAFEFKFFASQNFPTIGTRCQTDIESFSIDRTIHSEIGIIWCWILWSTSLTFGKCSLPEKPLFSLPSALDTTSSHGNFTRFTDLHTSCPVTVNTCNTSRIWSQCWTVCPISSGFDSNRVTPSRLTLKWHCSGIIIIWLDPISWYESWCDPLKKLWKLKKIEKREQFKIFACRSLILLK